MQYMKLSTSRDFRISTSTLESTLQEHNTEEAENEPDNNQVRALVGKRLPVPGAPLLSSENSA